MRNIFLQKSYTDCGGETIPRPFSENLKLHISVSIVLTFYTVCCFHCQVEGHQNILKLSCIISKTKRSGTSLPASFSVEFLKKINSCYILLIDQV